MTTALDETESNMSSSEVNVSRNATWNRVLNVIRMQLINKDTFIRIPLIVLGGAIVVSILIYLIIPGDGPFYGGGAQAPMWYFMVVGVQSLTLTFPFSQALSVSRRTFFIGTTITAVLGSAGLATVFIGMALVERWTTGYFVNGYMIQQPWVTGSGLFATWCLFFTATTLMFMLGFMFATVYKRWGPAVLTVLFVVLGLFLVGILWLVTTTESWPAVGQWFGTVGPLGVAGVLLALTIAGGFASYGILRRLTPQ